MEFSLRNFNLQDYENALEATQKEKRKIKINIHNRHLQKTQAFGGVGPSIQIDNNKSLKDLEDDYHKIYMSKINLAEKLDLASQIYRLSFGTDNTQRLQKRPFIGRYEEKAWIRDMQSLDMGFLNTPYADAIQKISSSVQTYNENETDRTITKWYWQLKVHLCDVPADKNLSCSELLLVDVIAYDITYDCKKPMTKVLKFSTRRSGHVVQVCVTSIEGENGSHFRINFDFPLTKSTNKFYNMIRMENGTMELLSPGLDLPNFIKSIIWNEMDELF